MLLSSCTRCSVYLVLFKENYAAQTPQTTPRCPAGSVTLTLVMSPHSSLHCVVFWLVGFPSHQLSHNQRYGLAGQPFIAFLQTHTLKKIGYITLNATFLDSLALFTDVDTHRKTDRKKSEKLGIQFAYYC